ncbi:MAG: hypothetical protein OXG42_03215 [Chloroflexi bacterium]|nr:hypothetical protein [Chloroflexota bacterium]
MLVNVIFLILFAGAWSFLALLSWIALSLRRRARGALWAAPFAWLAGIGGGALVPLAGLDNQVGVGVSMMSALICSGFAGWLSFQVWDAFDLGERFSRLARRNR